MDTSPLALPSSTWEYDHLFSISRPSAAVHAVVVGLTAYVIWPWLPEFASMWAGAMAVFTCSLAALSFTYPKRPATPRSAWWYGVVHSITVVLIGVTWGLGSWVVAASSDRLFLFYTFALGGTALGAVSSQHSLMRSCLLSIWTSIPLLAYAHESFGDKNFGSALALMIVVFGITLTVTALRMNRFLANSVSLTEQLHDKVDDLTALSHELKEARDVAEHANRSKTELLAQASHDLRHPIHAIGLFVEALRSKIEDTESRALIERIDQSVDGMARLFRTLLDMSALDLGRIKANPTSTQINRILEGISAHTEDETQAPRIRFVPCSLWVHTDPTLLHTIVQNLTTNALKYSDGSDVVIGCRHKNGTMSIEVHDAGPGIEAEELERVFEPFVRLRPLDLGTGEGLGLGLSIVKRMSALLGLSLRIRSTPGKHTMMAVDGLQICQEPIADSSPSKSTTALENFTVCVLEPDPDLQEALTHLLSGWGCDVLAPKTAANIPEGANFVLIDSRTLRDTPPPERGCIPLNIPVAIMADKSDVHMSLPQDAHLLNKPVRPIQLRSLLLTVSSRRAFHD
ncbi:MAG: HAMP domain-containing histidine kinase [Methylocystaceae bacterium]|nr:HAMP domain-containing histidine kinase [Methylocystaceae bacterium]